MRAIVILIKDDFWGLTLGFGFPSCEAQATFPQYSSEND